MMVKYDRLPISYIEVLFLLFLYVFDIPFLLKTYKSVNEGLSLLFLFTRMMLVTPKSKA